MQASELRIGNYTTNGTVETIFKDHFYTKVGDIVFSSKAHEANAIPLTDQLLVSFGFFNVVDEIYDIELPNARYLSIDIGKKKAYIGSRVDWIEIKYPESVHETQNLYFSLSGTELTLKP